MPFFGQVKNRSNNIKSHTLGSDTGNSEHQNELSMAFESVRNYYENLVIDEIRRQLGKKGDDGYRSDIACVALNHLPPRYYRHEVDMFFYLSPEERKETLEKVKMAVINAIAFIEDSKKD